MLERLWNSSFFFNFAHSAFAKKWLFTKDYAMIKEAFKKKFSYFFAICWLWQKEQKSENSGGFGTRNRVFKYKNEWNFFRVKPGCCVPRYLVSGYRVSRLGIQIRNMKVVFKFYGTWHWVTFEKLMMKIYDFFLFG